VAGRDGAVTVLELIEKLKECDPKRIVIMSADSEGNNFSPLADMEECAYRAETTWYGESGPEKLTPELEERGFTEEDIIDGEPALCLWPVN
jgi:hypothetical protein